MSTATATSYKIDVAHSTVEFAVKHMMVATVRGQFTEVSGDIVYNAGNPASSSVNATINVASIATRDAQRDGHLKSPDFFDADNFPTITFASTSVTATGASTLRVDGNLTIHGVTRPVSLTATIEGEGKSPFGHEIIAFSAETAVSRKDFGLVWNVALETGGVLVGDAIKITLDVEAIKQA